MPRWMRDRVVALIITAFMLLVAANSVLTVVLLDKSANAEDATAELSTLTRAGKSARDRQVQIFPVQCDLYVDGYQRGVLSRFDLAQILDHAPGPCPDARVLLHGGRPPAPKSPDGGR